MSKRERSNPHMPEEIVMDILSRLPVKSLLQFRSVSKKWMSIIDDKQLIRSHLSRSLLSSNNHRLLLPTFPLQSVNYNASPDMANASLELDCPFVTQDTQIKIVGSCNGLVCFLVDNRDLIIYNPSTRHSKTLLAPQRSGSSKLGIDVVHGFGCSLSSPFDFKLVVFSRFSRFSKIYPDLVLGQNDSSWRTLNMTRSFDFLSPMSTFLNGSFHWLARHSGGEKFIASFDFSEEVLKEICLPPDINSLPYNKFGELKGDLYVLCDNPAYAYVDLWVMKEYGDEKSWMIFCKVPRDMAPGRITYIVPLTLTKDGDVLLEVDLRGFVAYDTKKTTFRNVMVGGGPNWAGSAVVYVESLVSPNGVE